jgi:CelD/BcsL family acetyltransferase involved in cellulose biosynthesis
MSVSLSNKLASVGSDASCGRTAVSVYQAGDWPQVAPLWTELSRSSPYSSVYLSTHWIAAWLEMFADSLPAEILVFRQGGAAVGACLLVACCERRGPFRVRRIYLNTGGGPPADQPMVEFNNLLCRAGFEQKIAQALGAHLRSRKWEEFAMEGICPGPILSWLQTDSFSEFPASITTRASYYVDLNRLRRSGLPYESWLSPNTREQVRRSLRLYEKLGAVRGEVARDLPTAEQFFAEMCRMHQSTWQGRGEPGAFASARKLAFHRSLIRRAFVDGAIQLVRVTAGEETIGILYNFVEKDKVYFYQSGFHYRADKRLKPGLVTHVCAIQLCLEAGYKDYDFLAGEARYKKSLAKDSRPLAWVVFSRPSVKLALIEFLRTMKARIRRRREPR